MCMIGLPLLDSSQSSHVFPEPDVPRGQTQPAEGQAALGTSMLTRCLEAWTESIVVRKGDS